MKKARYNPDRMKIRKQKHDRASEMQTYLDHKMSQLNKELARNVDENDNGEVLRELQGGLDQNSHESLAKPKTKGKSKSKKVNFYPPSNQDSEAGPHPQLSGQYLPPRHPETSQRQFQPARRHDSGSRSRRSMGCNSSVENYQRYYGDARPDANLLKDLSMTQSRIEPDHQIEMAQRGGHLRRHETAGRAGGSNEFGADPQNNDIGINQDFMSKSRKHYNDYKEAQQRQKSQKQVNQFFEPQFIKENLPKNRANDQSSDDEDDDADQFQRIGFGVDDKAGQNNAQVKINYGMNWIAKPTKEGFLYFCIPGTNTYQWDFPKVYDPKKKQNKYLFTSHWIKKKTSGENGSKKYWQHRLNPNFKQTVKPHSQTYLIQAAIEGNLAFLELYTKFKGELAVCDQSGRSALIHAISNEHIQFIKMLCEFNQVFKHQLEDPQQFTNIIELSDRHGNTPLFIAIRINNPKIVDVLISYQCNLYHRRQNGNTCLHECAIHSSVDCLTLLASFCGQDLFHVINKEGYSALDLALQQQGRGSSGTSEITIALQKLQRNLMYQNAVVDSNLAYVDKQKSKQQANDRHRTPYEEEEFEDNRQWKEHVPPQRKAKTHRSAKESKHPRKSHRHEIPADVSSLSSTSDIVRPKQHSLRPKSSHRTKPTRRSAYAHHASNSTSHSPSSQSRTPSDESYGKRRHLPNRRDLQFDGGNPRGIRPQGTRPGVKPRFSDEDEQFDEKRYMKHVRNQRKERRQQKLQDQYVPSFRKFKQEVKQKRHRMSSKQREEDLDRDYRQMFEEQQMRAAGQGRRPHQSSRDMQISQRYGDRDGERHFESKQYYEKMRHQKNHFAQAFGEESYFKGEDFQIQADRSKSKSKIILEQQSRMHSQRQSRFEIPEDAGQNDDVVREVTRRLYSPTPEEGGEINTNRPSHASHRSGASKRPYEGEMYNSRMVNNTVQRSSINYTIDDIEKQRFRVPRNRRSGEPDVESLDERQIDRIRPRNGQHARSQSVKALRDQGYSIVEKAYKNTTSTLYTIGSYIYNGLSRMRDYINDPSLYYNSYNGGRHHRQGRAKSVHYQDSWMDRRHDQDLDYYPRGRQRQITHMRPSDDYSSYSDDQRSEPSYDQYFTAHGNGRSKSRMASRARSRTLQRAPQNMMDQPEFINKYPVMKERQYSSDSSDDDEEEYQENNGRVNLFTPVTDQHDGSNRNQQQMEEQVVVMNEQKQSVSIQADSMIRKTKRKKVKTIKRSRIEASRHSIGVGSICIDDEINIEQTETIYETVNVQKKQPVKKQKQINNETVQSIASQKLEHSRMISFQRQRRTGKRLGKKAQQNLMESKHFQSSDEEKLQIQQSIQLSEQIEPAPHYLKQEVNYLKVKEAYDKQDAKRISIELKKMKELDDEQSKLLKKQQDKISAKSQQVIENLENYDKAFIKGQENEKKEQSTPTRQSTQMNRKSYDAQANASKLENEIINSSREKVEENKPTAQKKPSNGDIDDFYNQLIANNLSTTKVEDQINDGKIQQALAKVQSLDKDRKNSQQNRESILKQLYEGLDITEDPSLSKQLEMLKNAEQQQQIEDGLAFDGSESEINFNINECNDSLRIFQEQDTITDLEEGAKPNKMPRPQVQKVEQLEFFGRYSDGMDSLDMAVEGSWLNPVQNFGECLSDCTFILEQDKNVRALYGSQMNSNVFDKGQLMNSVNNYSYFSQNQGNPLKRSMSNVNLSMGVGQQILSGLNHNNSGFGFVTSGPSLLTPNSPEKPIHPKRPLDPMRMSLKKPKIPQPSKEKETQPVVDSGLKKRSQSSAGGRIPQLDNMNKNMNQNQKQTSILNSDDDKQFQEIDENAFNKIIEQNIKAIPKRRMNPLKRAERARKRSESRSRKLQAAQQKQEQQNNMQEQDYNSEKETEQEKQQPFKSLISNGKKSPAPCPSPPNDRSASKSSSQKPESHKDSEESIQPGALTRISDECPARVDQAICDTDGIGQHLVHLNETVQDDGDEEPQSIKSSHVQVARNYEEVGVAGKSASQQAEDECEEVPEIAYVQEAPVLEVIEEKSMETSTQIVVLKGNKFGQKKGQIDKPSHSARRYDQEAEENSVLEKSQVSVKTGPKQFQSITGAGTDNKTMEKSKLIDQTNADCTEIDFNLTQNMTQMNVTSLNQTSILKTNQIQPPNVKTFTQFEQIDEEVNEGTDALTRKHSDSFGPAGSFVESSQRLSMLKKLNVETQNLQIQEEEEEQVKPEETKSNLTPLKINDRTNLYGTFNPCSEHASSDADVPKLKNKTSQALKCLMSKMPSYPSDLEPSKLPSNRAKGMLVDPLNMMNGFETQTITNSAKSPKEDKEISQTDTNSILGKGMTSSSILGNMIAQRRPYTSEGESVQARNMRKWQSLKPPKEGAKNLKLRVSSASRSRGSSQNNKNENNNNISFERKSDKISIKSSKKSDKQSNNIIKFENQKIKNTQDETDSLNNREEEPLAFKEPEETPLASKSDSKQAQLAEKLQRLRRNSSINHFQGPQSSRLNSTNLSNKKSIRDISYRNANSSSAGVFGAGSSSILTDNSERLRENLEALRKSKQAKEARSLSKKQSEGSVRRKNGRANTIKQ